ncbi:MAG: FAD-dependent oxidoreductase [Pseudomonadota bacterium]
MQRRALLASGASALLARFLPASRSAAAGAAHRPSGYLRTNWSRDPYSLGSYSYIANGSPPADRTILNAPVGNRIYFAGEAAHPPYEGTVHAAYESGLNAAAAITRDSHRSVGVIGAGISGLSAAHALSKAGLDVRVFEARDRTGGRIWTDNTLGVPLDLGGSWIHGDEGNPLVGLAAKADADTLVTDEDYIVRGDGGRRLGWLSTPGWLETVASWEASTGADYALVDWQAYEQQDDYEGDDLMFPSGYETILQTLAGDYEVTLGTEIDGVVLDQGGAVLRYGSTTVLLDAVLVTVPLGVLKAGKLAFDPPLPANKQQAIQRMGMGTLDKLYLRFDEAFWDADTTWILTPDTGLPRGQFNQWLNLMPYLGEPILMAFNAASAALALAELDDETLVGRAADVLSRTYPD